MSRIRSALSTFANCLCARPETTRPEPSGAPSLAQLDSERFRLEEAKYVFRLAYAQSRWIARHVDTFKFVEADTVRRRQSLDFALPQEDGLKPMTPVSIPIMLLTKQNLRNLDISDESGKRLSVLTSDQNSQLARRSIEVYLAGAAPEGIQLTKEQRDAVWKIVSMPSVAASQIANSALSPMGCLRNVVDGIHDEDERRNVETLIKTLAEAFMLLTVMPYQPRRRRIVKVSFDAQHRVGVGTAAWRRLPVLANRLLSTFGLTARREVFANLAVGRSQSYHAEIVPPSGMYIAEASLEIENDRGVPTPDPVFDDQGYRAHVRTDNQWAGDRGRLTVLFQAHRENLVLPLLLSSAIITVALWLVPRNISRLDGQSLAALLLVPFALAAYYGQAGEHSYLTRSLRGVRFLAASSAMCGVAMITLIGLGYLSHPRLLTGDEHWPWPRFVLEHAGLASLVATGLIACSFVSPTLGGISRRPLRRFQASARRWSQATRVRLRRVSAVIVLLVVVLAAYGAWRAWS